MNYQLLGAKIKRVRKQMRMTQEQFAELIGISAAFVGHIERGTRIPSLETIYRICKATGASADRLLDL